MAQRLRSLDLDEVIEGVGRTGVKGILRGGKPGRTLLIRADMDALPVQEETGLGFASETPGKMHACGHDGHTSILLTAARLLARRRDEIAGTVVFCFQPAEEGGGGARAMMEAGIMENPHVDASIGLHILQQAPVGEVRVITGPCMSGVNGYRVTINGTGGHGAEPHTTVDPLLIAATIITNLQSLVAREIDPLKPVVLTQGTFHAGTTAANIIPDTATFSGTCRFYDMEVGAYVAERLPVLVRGMAESMRATAEVEYRQGGYPVMNDPAMVALVGEAAAAVPGVTVTDGPRWMPSEDYSEFTRRVPSCYFFVGSKNEDTGQIWGHHHPKFDFDERALTIGAETFVGATLRYLNGE